VRCAWVSQELRDRHFLTKVGSSGRKRRLDVREVDNENRLLNSANHIKAITEASPSLTMKYSVRRITPHVRKHAGSIFDGDTFQKFDQYNSLLHHFNKPLPFLRQTVGKDDHLMFA
jgi:hypothetical protein